MRPLKLTAFSFLITSVILFSCKQEDYLVPHIYENKNIVMSGDQEVPAVVTAATGNIQATYNQITKTLTYKITWSGLSSNAKLAHIHGTAEAGFVASPIHDISSLITKTTAGSYSGSMFVDGIKIIEEQLLAGKYYFNIHSDNYTGGEIRGQLILNKK